MKYGVSQKILLLLKNMYDRVVSAVKVKNGLSSSFRPLVGVRQGCNLSPTLFNMFVNDIVDLFDSTCGPVHMKDCEINCLLYADLLHLTKLDMSIMDLSKL